MFDEPIPLRPHPFRLTSSDPQLCVQFEGGRFLVSGTASDEGELELSRQQLSWQANYATGSDARTAVERLEGAVSGDVMLLVEQRGEQVSVRPLETVSPAAPLPRVVVLSSDAGLLVNPRAVNQIALRGRTGGRCLVTLRVDARSVALQFEADTTAPAIAERLSRAVPFGYRATADRGVLSVWHDATSDEIAA